MTRGSRLENWAFVIGIDRYELSGASLKGAVRDALGMREWLLAPTGGNVPEKNLLLLLSPREDAEPTGVAAAEATQGNILDAIADLIRRSGGEGERLYFFFAGHGVSTFVSASEENALVAADFTSTRTQNSVALRTLWEYFETWQFRDQFFFVDACRNIPVDFDFRVGEWTQPRRRDPGLPPVQQFILYATSPGLRAAEMGAPGDERGHFTDALLAGLRGAGSAKAWSRASQSYEVRWDRLVRYVKKVVEDRKVKVGGPGAENIFQIPQENPKRGVAGRDPDPVLARFPANSFPAEKLAVNLLPEDVYSVAEVIVSREWGEPFKRQPNIPRLPVEFELEPNVYLIRGTAPNYEEAYYVEPLELYSERAIEVDFKPASPGQPEAQHGLPEEAGGTEPGAAIATGASPTDEPSSGTLVVKSSDPLAAVEIADAAGRSLATTTGTAELRDLPAGVYRARLRTPENELVEKLVEVAPGAERVVALSAPGRPETPAVTSLVEAVGGRVLDDNTIEIHGAGTPIATPNLSTVMAVAGAAALHDDKRMRELGFRAAREALRAQADCGLYLLLGVDWDDAARAREYLGQVGLRIWRLGDAIPDAAEPARVVEELGYAAELARAVETGTYWLALELPEAAPIVVTLAVLPKRVTMLTLEVGERQPRIYGYAPSLLADRSSDPDEVRRLEVMERLLLGGQLAAGFDVARAVVDSRSADPLAMSLAGYIALRVGRVADIGDGIERFANEYGDLSDAHVLRGEHEATAQRSDGARDAFARAVEAGAPVFAEGLTRLLEGLRAYGIEHPNAELVTHIFERHLSGSIWSAWRPDRFEPGQLIIP